MTKLISTNDLPHLLSYAPTPVSEREKEEARNKFTQDDDELPSWMETEEEFKNRFPREISESERDEEIDEFDQALSDEQFDGMFGDVRRPFLACLDELAVERKRQLGQAITEVAADYADRNNVPAGDTIFVVVDSEQDARVGNEALDAFRKAG
jgi:hypothetical protein